MLGREGVRVQRGLDIDPRGDGIGAPVMAEDAVWATADDEVRLGGARETDGLEHSGPALGLGHGRERPCDAVWSASVASPPWRPCCGWSGPGVRRGRRRNGGA